MVAGCGNKIAKLLLFIINFSVWVSSLCLVGLGIWMLVESARFSELFAENNITPIAGIILGLGCFCFLVGFCGCCGALKENICFLKTYFILMLLIVLGELTAGILALVYRDEIERSLTNGMTSTIQNNYGFSTASTESVDSMQNEFDCCGAYNYTTYENSKWQNNQTRQDALPDSCCASDTKDTCSYLSTTLYDKGCVEASLSTIEGNIAILAGVCLGVLLFEIFAMIFSCCLIDAIQGDKA